MASSTPPPPSSSSSASSSSSSPSGNTNAAYTTPENNGYTPSEWTQQSLGSDLLQQKGLLIGVGALLLAFLFFRGRGPKPEERAARKLVRDWRKVEAPSDARDLLGENLPTIIRPVLLTALEEIERQVHQAFRKAERELNRL